MGRSDQEHPAYQFAQGYDRCEGLAGHAARIHIACMGRHHAAKTARQRRWPREKVPDIGFKLFGPARIEASSHGRRPQSPNHGWDPFDSRCEHFHSMKTSSSSSVVAGRYWHALDDGRVQCDLCPRECKLQEGQRGLCFVRAREGRQDRAHHLRAVEWLLRRSIEKKPLNHFLPGTRGALLRHGGLQSGLQVLPELGHQQGAGDRPAAEQATPRPSRRRALAQRLRAVAFTYNDPVIFLGVAVDVAEACRERGVKTVAVTAG